MAKKKTKTKGKEAKKNVIDKSSIIMRDLARHPIPPPSFPFKSKKDYRREKRVDKDPE